MQTQRYKDACLILQNTSAPWHSVELVQATQRNSNIHTLYVEQYTKSMFCKLEGRQASSTTKMEGSLLPQEKEAKERG